MGKVVGAALVSHHPGLMQCEEVRRLMGNGEDSDLIAGYARVRNKINAARPDVVILPDPVPDGHDHRRYAGLVRL